MKQLLALILFMTVTTWVTVVASQSVPQNSVSQNEARAAVIELSGESYFPDGIAARADGTLYVGSMWTGQIDMIPHDMSHPMSFIPPEVNGRTVLGLLVDEDANRLWAVFWDFQGFMTIPAQLKAFDLQTGELVEVYDFPDGVIGNDLTMDGDGNIYTTCSFTHRIFRLPVGGNALEVWSDDPVLAADHQEGWTLNGIAWNGADWNGVDGNVNGSLYLSRTDNDGIYQVSIENDGSAGIVQQIAIEDTQSNMGYDGIVALDADTILVTEYGTNRLTIIDITGNQGSKHIVNTELDFPTNATIVGDGAWVVESQIDHMLYADTAGVPQVPFLLRYVPLPPQ